jgi:hypothetical protein
MRYTGTWTVSSYPSVRYHLAFCNYSLCKKRKADLAKLTYYTSSGFHIVQCWGLLNQFWPPIVPCYALKTPFGLLIPLLQSQSHVTTIIHNYLLRCYAFTQFKSSHTVAYAKPSLHTANLSSRSHSANSLLLKHWLLRIHSGNWTKNCPRRAASENWLDISVLLINLQSY